MIAVARTQPQSFPSPRVGRNDIKLDIINLPGTRNNVYFKRNFNYYSYIAGVRSRNIFINFIKCRRDTVGQPLFHVQKLAWDRNGRKWKMENGKGE